MIIQHIIDALSDQNYTEMELSYKYNLQIEEIEEIMINAGYERCELCDYWFEMSEMLDENDEPIYKCIRCRDE